MSPDVAGVLAMAEDHHDRVAGPSRKKGRIILGAVVAGFVLLFVWKLIEPGRRASRMQQAIRPGMSVADVEDLLEGDHCCFHQIKSGDGWENVSREEFMEGLADQTAGAPAAARLWIWFFGLSPRRVSFSVEIDGSGSVIKATTPHGWD